MTREKGYGYSVHHYYEKNLKTEEENRPEEFVFIDIYNQAFEVQFAHLPLAGIPTFRDGGRDQKSGVANSSF